MCVKLRNKIDRCKSITYIGKVVIHVAIYFFEKLMIVFFMLFVVLLCNLTFFSTFLKTYTKNIMSKNKISRVHMKFWNCHTNFLYKTLNVKKIISLVKDSSIFYTKNLD